MDVNRVLFVESALTPWGSLIDPSQLTLSELRIHLQARGYTNTAGTRGELVMALKDLLQQEQQALWDQRQQNLSKAHRKLKRLVREIEQDDEDFDLAQANTWKQEFQDQGAWDWRLDPRSLHKRQEEARRKYEIALRARKRQTRHLEKEKEIKELIRKREEEELRRKEQQLLKEKQEEVKEQVLRKSTTCSYRSKVGDAEYYCVSSRFCDGTGKTHHVCPFHVLNCVDFAFHEREREEKKQQKRAVEEDDQAENGDDFSHSTTNQLPEVKMLNVLKMITPRVRTPNELGLCVDCYKRVTGKNPRPFEKHTCPGTHQVRPELEARLAMLHAGYAAQSTSQQREERPSCCWATKTKTGKKLKCTNRVMRFGKKVCVYHNFRCELVHPGSQPKIQIPNSLGVCKSHYLAKKGVDPSLERESWAVIDGQKYPPGIMEIRKPVIPKTPHTLRPFHGSPFARLAGIMKARTIPNKPGKSDDVDSEQVLQPGKELLQQELEQPLKLIDWSFMEKYDPLPNLKRRFDITLNRYVSKDFQAKAIQRKRNLKRILFGHRYALVIQRAYRGHVGREQAKRLLLRKYANLRWNAAVRIQAQIRGMLTRMEMLIYRQKYRKAIEMFQRVVRGHLSRAQMKRLRAVMTLQRYVRGFLCRLELVAKDIITRFRRNKEDRAWAQFVIIRHMKRYIKNWKKQHQVKVEIKKGKSAARIQAFMRGYSTRRKVLSYRNELVETDSFARTLQRFMRWIYHRSLREKKFWHDTKHATIIQAAWRGFRARVRANVEREAIEKAWRWVDPKRPRTAFSHLMPKHFYNQPLLSNGPAQFWMDKNRVRVHDLLLGMKLGQPKFPKGNQHRDDDDDDVNNNAIEDERKREEEEADEESLSNPHEKLWSHVPFLAFDLSGKGTIKRQEFRIGLQEMGYRMSETQINEIVKRWSRVDGTVNYLNFLDYVKQETMACAMHRAWACPTCVSFGPCVKCKCKKYNATKHGEIASSRAVCECGHYIAMHNMIPKVKAGRRPGATNEALSKGELKRILAPPSQPALPRNIVGTKLNGTSMQMQFRQSDLKVRAQTALPSMRRDKRTALKLGPAVNGTKQENTSHFQRLSEKIISDITKESEQLMSEILADSSWNTSVNPLDTYPGTAKPTHSHAIPGIGDIERPQTVKPRKQPQTRQGMKHEPVEVDVNEEERAIEAETCDVSDLGLMLLESAARPHTATYQLMRDNLSSSSGKRPQYVDRLIRARTSQLKHRAELNKKPVWTNREKYEKGFDLTDPIPIIVNDNLRMEVNAGPLYVDMLLALSNEECGLLEDWSAFVSYVFQSFAFMDRHWRKLVHDMRAGMLDKHLPIDAETRRRVEKELKPNPNRAKLFDKSMQQLGFYKQRSMEHESEEKQTAVLEKQEKKRDFWSAAIHDKRSNNNNVNTETWEPEKFATLTPRVMTSSKASLELELDTKELKRRTDAIVPSDVYHLVRHPRTAPVRILESRSRTRRRYGCSFPGCGKVFSQRRSAELHAEKEHTGKFRLAATSTAEIDQKMHAYWPKHSPWNPNEKKHLIKPLNDPVLEARLARQDFKICFPYSCTRKNCDGRFKTEKELKAHVQARHVRAEKMLELIGSIGNFRGVNLQGTALHVPPNHLPTDVYLLCCSKHWVLLQPKCMECEKIIRRGDPIPPLEFFPVANIHDELIISAKANTCVHIRITPKEEYLGRVIAIFRDKFGRIFIAYKRYFSYQEAATLKMPLDDFDPTRQLVMQDDPGCKIAKVDQITGSSVVLLCHRQEFYGKLDNHELPRLNKLSHVTPLREPNHYFYQPTMNAFSHDENGKFIPLVERLRGVAITNNNF